ncbi:NAD(P)-dependent oxidoreductase [Devosia sp. A8/3-2]|nr:NAD(P)-dependent oxidoreductase [Devosia sp. A8/3-2]
MTKVLVTGGSGKLGRAVLRDLVAHGYEVLNIDQQALSEPICPTVRIDLTNFGEVAAAILGGVDERKGPFDAVVHLAAIPAPGLAANARTFANNVTTSYNVFEACRPAGIKNVVFASSETVLGLPFDNPPPYAPVDEEYFPRPKAPIRWASCSTKPWPPNIAAGTRPCAWSACAFPTLCTRKTTRPSPNSTQIHAAANGTCGAISTPTTAPGPSAVLSRADFTGFEAFIIANADTVMSRSNMSLLAEVFPNVEQKGNIATNSTLLSIEKAKRMLGYSPQFSWRNEV